MPLCHSSWNKKLIYSVEGKTTFLQQLGTRPAMMITSQDPPLDENPTLHWVLSSERWEDIVITAEPELDTILIENNYLDVSAQEIKRSYFDRPHSQCRKP